MTAARSSLTSGGTTHASVGQLADQVREALHPGFANDEEAAALAALAELEQRAAQAEEALRPFAKAGRRLLHEGSRGYRLGHYDDKLEVYRFRVGDVICAWHVLDSGSSSGRTPGFGPGDEGSTPSPETSLAALSSGPEGGQTEQGEQR